MAGYGFMPLNGESEFWQYDTSQALAVINDIREAHFAVPDSDDSIVIRVEDGKVDIPDELLSRPGRLRVYAYTSPRTLIEAEWPIKPRPKPTGYVATPAEAQTWDRLSASVATLEAAADAETARAEAEVLRAAAENQRVATMESLMSSDNHRNIYRGKNLGTAITADQKAAIRAGTFDDLFIGDYWTLDDVKYVIADMDYWYNIGNPGFNVHHLVMIPENTMYNALMNDTDTTEGGYIASKMYTDELDQARTTIETAFGDMLQTHKEILINAVTNGYPSGYSWYECTAELMTEVMVYGCRIYSPARDGQTNSVQFTVNKQQLALFALNPKTVHNRQSYWLRDVVSSANFALVHVYGSAHQASAAHSYGVRPVFAIG